MPFSIYLRNLVPKGLHLYKYTYVWKKIGVANSKFLYNQSPKLLGHKNLGEEWLNESKATYGMAVNLQVIGIILWA